MGCVARSGPEGCPWATTSGVRQKRQCFPDLHHSTFPVRQGAPPRLTKTTAAGTTVKVASCRRCLCQEDKRVSAAWRGRGHTEAAADNYLFAGVLLFRLLCINYMCAPPPPLPAVGLTRPRAPTRLFTPVKASSDEYIYRGHTRLHQPTVYLRRSKTRAARQGAPWGSDSTAGQAGAGRGR